MKKKLFTLLCAITCVLSLCACGKKAAYTEMETTKLQQCEALTQCNVEIASMYAASTEDVAELTTNYNKEEMAALYQSIFYNYTGSTAEAELGAFNGMLSTYAQAANDMGGITGTGNMTSEIVGKTIVVTMELFGNKCDGKYVFKYSNDIFTRLQSGEATAKTTLKMKLQAAGSQMGKAGLNTLLGMGTVFIVLILISFIIASFNLFKKDNKKQEAKVETVAEPVAEENLADDTELVAVIMAAISAYEGSSSTDGFVVRSIKKANRRK